MARTYDKMIRFYDSWFADLADPDKALTPEECWRVVSAIVECQRTLTKEPLFELPLAIRRALSMATLSEQIERMFEKTQRMAARGRKGGIAAASASPDAEPVDPQLLAEPQDGRERNYTGIMEFCRQLHADDEQTLSILLASEYGLIGHPFWKIVSRSRTTKNPLEYIMAAING